jgi:hypothetical protein
MLSCHLLKQVSKRLQSIQLDNIPLNALKTIATKFLTQI